MILVDENRNVIQHYGVIGMRWGVRKERAPTEKARRNKAANVLRVQRKADNKTKSDVKSAQWMSKTIPQKAFHAAMSAGLSVLISAKLIEFSNPAALTPKVMKKIAIQAIRSATINSLSKEVAGRSAMKRYKYSGERNTSKKQYKKFTPELALQKSIKLATLFGPTLFKVGKAGLKVAYINRMKSQARVDAWGQNILPKKTSELHTIYDDGYMSVLEKIKG